jgi:glycosyltransferase involved in cell wall biosynthesis
MLISHILTIFDSMLNGKSIAIVLPAYNAAKTLEKTYHEIPMDIVDTVVLVDDASKDQTTQRAEELGISNLIRHEENRGYGANQKSCYAKALELEVDIIIMLHADYQYTPKLIHAMSSMIAYDVYPVVIGSRILGKGALKGGMPIYKYIANRFLTSFQNVLMAQKLSEYHTGYRAFSKEVFQEINIENNSDDFVFDNQMLAQLCFKGYSIGEVSCPTKYDERSSSINFKRSIIYGLGVMKTAVKYRLAKWRIYTSKIFK